MSLSTRFVNYSTLRISSVSTSPYAVKPHSTMPTIGGRMHLIFSIVTVCIPILASCFHGAVLIVHSIAT